MSHNGHIGFNEPGEYFYRDTHVVELTKNTREANARFFVNSNDVPTLKTEKGVNL